jgi:hypothetical protein
MTCCQLRRVMPTEIASASLQITAAEDVDADLAFARGRLCVGMTVKGRLLALELRACRCLEAAGMVGLDVTTAL